MWGCPYSRSLPPLGSLGDRASPPRRTLFEWTALTLETIRPKRTSTIGHTAAPRWPMCQNFRPIANRSPRATRDRISALLADHLQALTSSISKNGIPNTSRISCAKAMADASKDARSWLRANGYDDVADKIDSILDRWAQTGNSTRRNWWQILAGAGGGHPRRVAGVDFPVLRAAQRRQGVPVTKNAISRNKRETPPPVLSTGRWPQVESEG